MVDKSQSERQQAEEARKQDLKQRETFMNLFNCTFCGCNEWRAIEGFKVICQFGPVLQTTTKSVRVESADLDKLLRYE